MKIKLELELDSANELADVLDRLRADAKVSGVAKEVVATITTEPIKEKVAEPIKEKAAEPIKEKAAEPVKEEPPVTDTKTSEEDDLLLESVDEATLRANLQAVIKAGKRDEAVTAIAACDGAKNISGVDKKHYITLNNKFKELLK